MWRCGPANRKGSFVRVVSWNYSYSCSLVFSAGGCCFLHLDNKREMIDCTSELINCEATRPPARSLRLLSAIDLIRNWKRFEWWRRLRIIFEIFFLMGDWHLFVSFMQILASFADFFRWSFANFICFLATYFSRWILMAINLTFIWNLSTVFLDS